MRAISTIAVPTQNMKPTSVSRFGATHIGQIFTTWTNKMSSLLLFIPFLCPNLFTPSKTSEKYLHILYTEAVKKICQDFRLLQHKGWTQYKGHYSGEIGENFEHSSLLKCSMGCMRGSTNKPYLYRQNNFGR